MRARRPLAALLVVGAMFVGTSSVRSQDGFSLRLTDPRTGETTVLEHGPEALHIVFIATWCPPCLEELEALSDLHDRWRHRGYRLVVIGVRRRQTAERLSRLASNQVVPGRLLFDGEGIAQRRFGAESLPTHVVVDAGGKVVLRVDNLDDGVEQALEELLGSRPGRERGP